MNKNKFYVVKLLTNTAEQDASSIAVFNGATSEEARTKAFVNFHQTLATYHNASDVLYAVVQVKNVEGTIITSEIVDHIPEPEPEPEEETPVVAG